jgi:DNA-binding response OmpR family regulator
LNKVKKILIVDDDDNVTFTFKIGLENYGFEVYTYNDPVLALSHFKPNFYDLLLIDIRMPKINGFELSQKIRNRDKLVKICFITAFEIYYKILVEKYPLLDFKCFLKKPIMIDVLKNRIKSELDLD